MSQSSGPVSSIELSVNKQTKVYYIISHETLHYLRLEVHIATKELKNSYRNDPRLVLWQLLTSREILKTGIDELKATMTSKIYTPSFLFVDLGALNEIKQKLRDNTTDRQNDVSDQKNSFQFTLENEGTIEHGSLQHSALVFIKQVVDKHNQWRRNRKRLMIGAAAGASVITGLGVAGNKRYKNQSKK